MNRTQHIALMAQYNEWMNTKLYEAASHLPAEAINADRKAFFGSILGTLKHLVVADTIWLKRFATHPARYAALDGVRELPTPDSLSQHSQSTFTDLTSLAAHRRMLDQTILTWAQSIHETDLDHTLSYTNMQQVAAKRNFYALVMHFFNHQTHHRGQTTTLLTQAGVDIGVTDLPALIPDLS